MSLPYGDEEYPLDVSDSSESEIDEERMMEGKDGSEEVVLPSGDGNGGEKEMETEDPYDFDEEENDDLLHAFSEHDTPMERSMKQKKQRHRDKFATW